MVLPLIDDSIEDKIIILRANRRWQCPLRHWAAQCVLGKASERNSGVSDHSPNGKSRANSPMIDSALSIEHHPEILEAINSLVPEFRLFDR
jgi:hypothetical protein